jgi:hypothetical protein
MHHFSPSASLIRLHRLILRPCCHQCHGARTNNAFIEQVQKQMWYSTSQAMMGSYKFYNLCVYPSLVSTVLHREFAGATPCLQQ